MKFLANENIPRVSVLLIREAGFDIEPPNSELKTSSPKLPNSESKAIPL